MMICLICKKEILEADEKVVVTEVGARTINESTKQNENELMWRLLLGDYFYTIHAEVLTQMQGPLTSTCDS